MGSTVDKQIWLGVLLIPTSLVLYSLTLLKDVGFWDTAEFQTVLYTLDIAHPTGYPTYILLGKLFLFLLPLKNVALQINFLSSIFISLGLYFISNSIFTITKNRFVSILTPLLIMTSYVVWSLSTAADPHALHFLFTSLFIYLSTKILIQNKINFLPTIFLITGLSLGNHLLSIFFLLPLFLILATKVKKNRPFIIKSILLFFLGLSVYVLLPIISYFKPPLTTNYPINSLDSFSRHVFGRDFTPHSGKWIGGSVFSSIQFYSIQLKRFISIVFLPLALIGIVSLKKENRILNFSLSFIFLGTLLFSLRYQNAVIERYFASSFVVILIWISSSINTILRLSKKFKFIVLLSFTLIIAVQTAKNIKTNFPLVNQERSNSARAFAEKTMDLLPKNSIIISWWSYSTPLWYLQKVEGKRQDVLIINAPPNEWEQIALNLYSKKEIFLIDYIDLKNPSFKLIHKEHLYQFTPLSYENSPQ